MTLEEHCKETMLIFGDEFKEVHLWLDEFAGTPPYGMRHRKLRHHLAGIEEVKILFGIKEAEVAYQHIISDFKQEGWKEADPFPKNELEYIKLGLF
jgi:hypothetical protein